MPLDLFGSSDDKRETTDGLPRAEGPDSDPFGEDDLLLSFDYREKDGDSLFDGLKQRLDLVAVMITVIIAGATGYVGIQIMNTTVETGTGDADPSVAEDDPANATGFDNASLDLTDGLESFFSQLGTVFVVIVLVVIIGYLMLLRGR